MQKGFRPETEVGKESLGLSLERSEFMNWVLGDCRFCGLIWRVSMQKNVDREKKEQFEFFWLMFWTSAEVIEGIGIQIKP